MSVARIQSAAARAAPRSTSILFLTLLLGSLLTGCGSDGIVLPDDGQEMGQPAAIRVVTGDGQSGAVGEPLGAPVVVEVTDAEGLPVEGAAVAFELTSAGAGGEILPASATTNEEGRAEARVLLGDKSGLQTGEARVLVDGTTVSQTSFSAIADPNDPGNRRPRSDFDWDCEDLTCRFTDASTDDDGRIVARSWRFGDDDTSLETNPSHSYAEAGSYSVTLTVTDDDGDTDEFSAQVNVTTSPPPEPEPEPNKAPHAEFEVHCSNLTCTFTDKSKDDDGVIVSWRWIFGDGSTSSQQNPVHTYGSKGKYEVLLTVTDDRGAADTKDRRAHAKD